MIIRFLFVYCFLLILVLFSCKEDAPRVVGAAPGDVVVGIRVLDQFGSYHPDQSGVAISLLPTAAQAISDTNGLVTFTGVRAGTYQLSYEKAGWGRIQDNVFPYPGGPETIYWKTWWSFGPSLNEPSSVKIKRMELTGATGAFFTKQLTFRGMLEHPGVSSKRVYFTLLADTTVAVASDHFLYQTSLPGTVFLGADSTSVDVTLDFQLQETSFKPGDSVYFRIYTGSGNFVSDPLTGKKTYTGGLPHASSVFSFVY